MKKVFSFKAQKPPLRSRRESGPGGSAGETSRDFSKTEKYQKSERGGSIFCNFRYGAAAMQGFRAHMQDDFSCSPSESCKGMDFGYFAVFDGHGQYGDIVSKYCTEHFLNELLNRKSLKTGKSPTVDSLPPALKKTFVKFDAQLKEASRTHTPPPQEKGGDSEKISFTFSGTTATMALVLDRHIVMVNTGDSRTILCSSGGIRSSTTDHNPGDKVEDKRIIEAGGKIHTTPSKNKVILDPEKYTNLAVSRTLGDYGFKKSPTLPPEQQIVSPMPDVEVIPRQLSSDEFLLLASDGIFKSMSSSEAVAFVQQRMMVTDDLVGICRELIEMAYYTPDISPDDTTVVIVKFPAAHSVSITVMREDAALSEQAMALIQQEVTDIVANAEGKWVLENDYSIIQRLVGKLPKKFLVQLRTDSIRKMIENGRNSRFGMKEPLEEVNDECKGDMHKVLVQVPQEFTDGREASDAGESDVSSSTSSNKIGISKEAEEPEEPVNMQDTSESPSLLIRSGTGSNPSPLMAELGKAMLKRKKSESASSETADDSSDYAKKGIDSLISSMNDSDTFSELPKEASAAETSSTAKPVKVEEEEECSIEVKPSTGHLDKSLIRKCSTTDEDAANTKDITLTRADSPVSRESLEAGDVGDSSNGGTNMVSVSITVNCDKPDEQAVSSTTSQPTIRNSRVESYYFDDIDTGLDYMYDSDEKTTVL